MKQQNKHTVWSQLHSPSRVVGVVIFSIISFITKAQPIISSVVPNSGAVGTTVTISGNNFNATPANNIVFFGATQAVVQSATTTSLMVTVPAGATYQPISVVNLGTNLIGNSPNPFQVTFNAGVGQDITPASFGAKVDFLTGNNPAGIVAVADIDGDGKPDMVVVNRSANTFSILRNTSTIGTIKTTSFASKVDYLTDSTPSFVAIADIDGDGKQDIVVTSMFTNKISVYRNTATAGTINANSLAAKVNFISDTISMPTSVAIADLNGDGKPELVVTNSFSNTVSVLKNTSTAGNIDSTSFASAVDFTTGLGPTSVAVSDLDGDGKPDIVVSNFNAKSISILRNTSKTGLLDSTSFASKVDYKVGSGPNALTIADLNMDGKPDVLVANQAVNTVSILINNAIAGKIDSTSLNAKFDLPTNGASPYFVSAGNIDSDSLPDIVVANLISNNISVIKNNYTAGNMSAASFANGVNFATSNYPFSATIADVDGDGKADLAVADYGKTAISVYRNLLSNALPVSFLSFSGKYLSSGNALLNWKTGVETNTVYYIVERSANGVAFSEVGRVGVRGAGYQYSFSDALPLANSAATIYYRLVAVDIAGAKSFSSTVSVALNKNNKITIFPNPAKSYINIQSDGGVGNNLLLITDISGNLVLSTRLEDKQLQQIQLGSLAKGMYTATIFTPTGKLTKEILVK